MMKILAFSDLHGSGSSFNEVRKKASAADLILCAGDITVMEREMDQILQKINDLGKKVLLIHGNHEDEQGLREASEPYENIKFIHNAAHHINEYAFLGYGGGGFSKIDEMFERVATNFFIPEIKGKEKIILMTHAPPFKTDLDKINGDHRGNESIRNFIDRISPQIVIAGHLHENAGVVQRLGKTLFVNPGPKGIIIEI